MSGLGFEPFPADRELVLERRLDAPRDKLFRCWSTSELLRQWFTPKPWIVAHAEMDFRPGGWNHVEMRGPDGGSSVHRGVFLDIVENERIVFTDAFVRAWEPSGHAFIVADVGFADAGGGRTDYRVVVRHWSTEDTERHAAMGFLDGWGIVAGQMEEVARSL